MLKYLQRQIETFQWAFHALLGENKLSASGLHLMCDLFKTIESNSIPYPTHIPLPVLPWWYCTSSLFRVLWPNATDSCLVRMKFSCARPRGAKTHPQWVDKKPVCTDWNVAVLSIGVGIGGLTSFPTFFAKLDINITKNLFFFYLSRPPPPLQCLCDNTTIE